MIHVMNLRKEECLEGYLRFIDASAEQPSKHLSWSARVFPMGTRVGDGVGNRPLAPQAALREVVWREGCCLIFT